MKMSLPKIKPIIISKLSVLLIYSFAHHAMAADDNQLQIKNIINENHIPFIQSIIDKAIKKGSDVTGARYYLNNRKVMLLTPEKTIEIARKSNLSILAARQNLRIAQARVQQVDSSFDSVWDANISWNWQRSFERAEEISRLRKKEDDFEAQEEEFNLLENEFTDAEEEAKQTGEFSPSVENDEVGCVVVNGVQLSELCIQDPEFTTVKEFASSSFTPSRSTNGAISWTKAFAFGGDFNISLSSTQDFRNPSGLDFGTSFVSKEDPFLVGSAFRWTSSFSVNFFMPLPYTKGFGQYGDSGSLGIILADKRLYQSEQLLNSTLNTSLAETRNSYLELIRSLNRLYVTIIHRQNMEKILNRTLKRYKARLATSYAKAQIEAQYSGILNSEEIAWNNYISNSNLLVEKLGIDSNLIVIPTGFVDDLTKVIQFDKASAITTSMTNNATLNLNQSTHDVNNILLRSSKNQAKIDLSFNMSVSFSQSGTTFGYDSLEQSVKNIFHPDNEFYFIGLNFRRPWGNRSAQSSLNRARINYQKSSDQLWQQKNEIINTLNIVLATSYSTRSQISIAIENIKLAQLAFDRTMTKSGNLLSTEFEQLQKLDDLLNAKTGYIDAVINYKKVHVRFKSIQGGFVKKDEVIKVSEK